MFQGEEGEKLQFFLLSCDHLFLLLQMRVNSCRGEGSQSWCEALLRFPCIGVLRGVSVITTNG